MEIPELFENIGSMQKLIIEHWRKVDEDIIKKVLTQYFGRNFEIEDAKKVTKIYHAGNPSGYSLAVDGYVIGNIASSIDGNILNIKFTPSR